jgi:hypothetical protein
MRDLRLDFFRGVALIGITWNHTTPGDKVLSEWGHFQLKTNFFFSFAAVFIFISGIVCAIAYGSKISCSGWRSGIASIGDRIIQIALYNAIACWICIAIASTFSMLGVFTQHHSLTDGIFDSFLGSALQYDAIPFFDILNMYVAFLILLPLFLFFYSKWKSSFILSFITYISDQIYYYTTHSRADPIFFGSILSWQFLFFLGVAIGIERHNIKRVVSNNNFLILAALFYLFIGTYLWETKFAYHHFSNKTYLGILNILDILAVCYLITIFFEKQKILQFRSLTPILSIGKNSLPTFSLSICLSYLFSFLSELLVESRGQYLIILISELIILYLFGLALHKHPQFEKVISLKNIGISMILPEGWRSKTTKET